MRTIYTTWGSVRGCCGHRHRTPEAAWACLQNDRSGCRNKRGYSDREIYVAQSDNPYIDGYHTTKAPGVPYDGPLPGNWEG